MKNEVNDNMQTKEVDRHLAQCFHGLKHLTRVDLCFCQDKLHNYKYLKLHF